MCFCLPRNCATSHAGYVNVTSGNMDVVLNRLNNDGPLAVAIDASLKVWLFLCPFVSSSVSV